MFNNYVMLAKKNFLKLWHLLVWPQNLYMSDDYKNLYTNGLMNRPHFNCHYQWVWVYKFLLKLYIISKHKTFFLKIQTQPAVPNQMFKHLHFRQQVIHTVHRLSPGHVVKLHPVQVISVALAQRHLLEMYKVIWLQIQ